MVVEKEAEPDEPGWPQPLVERKHESHRPDNVRRVPPQYLAFHQRLPYETELVVFEIAQAPVDKLGGGGRGAAAEIAHFGKKDGVAASDGVSRDSAAVDATAYDEQIVDRAVQTGPLQCVETPLKTNLKRRCDECQMSVGVRSCASLDETNASVET